MRSHGGDPTVGPRLRALLSCGLEDVRERMVANRMGSVDDKLFLVQLVRDMRSAMLEAGAATDEQIDELEASVERTGRDPATTFHQARMHQVWGRRPDYGESILARACACPCVTKDLGVVPVRDLGVVPELQVELVAKARSDLGEGLPEAMAVPPSKLAADPSKVAADPLNRPRGWP